MSGKKHAVIRSQPGTLLSAAVAGPLLLLLVLFSSCLPTEPTPEAEPKEVETATETEAAAEEETPQPSPEEELIQPRTLESPEPDSPPGPMARGIADLAEQTNLSSTRFLGISILDWINLAIAALFVLFGSLLGSVLVRSLLKRLVRRTPSELDDELLKAFGFEIRWLIALLLLNFFVVRRLIFADAEVKTLLRDAYFVLSTLVIVQISRKAVGMVVERYKNKKAGEGHGYLAPVIMMVARLSRIVISLAGLIVLLSYFGINITALTTALGLGGLVVSLAAKETIADVIAGVILIIDRPFQIGDRIEIQGEETWGDVMDIGLRSTRVRTRDNRMVVIPNSILSRNQVINYSYPDSRYRIQTELDIAFGTDIETVRHLLIAAVRQVDGVLPEKPVDALYIDMSGAAMRFRLRWWIESYADTRRMFDRVHTVVQHALDEAGIVSPNMVMEHNVHMKFNGDITEQAGSMFQNMGQNGKEGDDQGATAVDTRGDR